MDACGARNVPLHSKKHLHMNPKAEDCTVSSVSACTWHAMHHCPPVTLRVTDSHSASPFIRLCICVAATAQPTRQWQASRQLHVGCNRKVDGKYGPCCQKCERHNSMHRLGYLQHTHAHELISNMHPHPLRVFTAVWGVAVEGLSSQIACCSQL